MPGNDRDVLTELVSSAERSIAEGYYEVEESGLGRRSLGRSIAGSRGVPIIAEIKFASPSEGMIREEEDVEGIARSYEKGGAAGISVLTEPRFFNGRIDYLPRVKRAVDIPVLMKDIMVDPIQMKAARAIGADAVLLISSIYGGGYCNRKIDDMIDVAHGFGLEVLVEAHTEEEFAEALAGDADLVGVNNRNLKTLLVSLDTSVRILRRHRTTKTVICESGITSPEEVRSLKALGANAFLIGSSIMKSGDVEAAVRTFTEA